jgi:uncharacterized membrane protein YczE
MKLSTAFVIGAFIQLIGALGLLMFVPDSLFFGGILTLVGITMMGMGLVLTFNGD